MDKDIEGCWKGKPKIIHWLNLERISLINPKAGKIRIYTSGWPKNQKRCWKSKRSPPLKGSKKEELKCLSKIIIVIHPANTGKLIINNKEVNKIDQGNKGKNKDEYKIERLQAFNKETIKLREPNKELNPAKCKENNIKSIQEEFIKERGT